MSWLHQLIFSLNEEELSEVKKIRLIGKEKEVFDYFLSFQKEEAPTQVQVCSEIQISDSHFYKINSILLDKIFSKLIPQGQYPLLEWLRKKELYALLKTEIKSQSKQSQNSEYLLNTFRLLIDLPFKFFDEKLTQAAGKAYLKSLSPCSESDKMYVKQHLIFADCNRFAASKNPIKDFNYKEADLLKMEEELSQSTHYLARYYLYRTLCNYYNYYKKQADLSLEYLKKAIQLKDKIAAFFPINIHQFLRLLYADALLSYDETEQAFVLYQDLFEEGIKEDMYGFYYHCEQYTISAILLEKYTLAEQLLQHYFDPCLARKNDIYATRGALTYAKLYLSNGSYKKALSYINKGIEINEKSFYLPFEIQLRALENMHFYLLGDFDFTKQLAQRNSKFIANQKAKELTAYYKNLFKFIAILTQCKEQNKALSIAQQEEYRLLQKKFRNVFGNLISLMYSQTTKDLD